MPSPVTARARSRPRAWPGCCRWRMRPGWWRCAAGRCGRWTVAAVNGPAETVVSGDPDAVRELMAACEGRGWRVRLLPVDYASHSPQVEDLEHEITSALAGIRPGPGRIPVVSAVTGELVAGPELDGGYWYASLRNPVRFDRAVSTLAGTGHQVFIEVSPHPVLAAAVTAVLEQDPGLGQGLEVPVVAGTLRRDEGGPARLLASLAAVHVRGISVDWAAVLGGGTLVELPTYAFQRERYWPAPRPAAAAAGGDGAGSAAEAGFWAAVEDGDS